MSDESMPVEVQGEVSETKESGGGLFRGSDGKISGRKLRVNLAYVAGMVFLGLGIFRGGSWLEKVAPGAVCLVYALIESGILTWQNVKEIIAAKSGGVSA